ncbi:MAG: DUF349 domain-containing protein [Butyricimonas faecihominis]
MYRTYREKKSEYYKKLEGEKEQNLKEKLQIIEELKDLIQHEESLNKTYQDFRNLQDRWRRRAWFRKLKQVICWKRITITWRTSSIILKLTKSCGILI